MSLESVSIRAPLSRAGRRTSTVSPAALQTVSIRAPLSRAGRPQSRRRHAWDARFNPRPAQSSGATRCTPPLLGMPFQSAPRSCRAGQLRKMDQNGTYILVFQSAPRSVERGDPCLCSIASRRLVSFNPRPAQSSGATDISTCMATRYDEVSIRAPLSRAGRPELPNSHSATHGFNPRPAQSSGATRTARLMDIAAGCFNPRPAQSSGATRS